jgi:predicted SAM-dependent methyltransferase
MQRLNIGASRFERMPLKYVSKMDNSSWTHLGDSQIDWKQSFRSEWNYGNWIYCARILYRTFNPRYTKEQLDAFYSATNFKEFYFEAGDQLEFEDNTFDFIYTEHVLEHFFLNEAFDLLGECYRILKPNGVIRIVVPDSDFRTYEKREPLSQLPILHPESHKTRWSIYSLPVAIKTAKLVPRPIMYCDKYGKFHENTPSELDSLYSKAEDKEFVFSLDYVQRLPSLIIDGIKV